MFGLGVVKGLSVTLKHFVESFVDDLKYFPKSMVNEEAFAKRQGPSGRGLFTVEYPEMKLKTPENFRFIPFLVTDYGVPKDSPDYDRAKWLEQNRCTSCGICAKACPPQCIWIVRTNDPQTGKPIPQPAEFYIDTDICMNCGYCAEFCPFDAIKMDHDYELADYERERDHIYDLERLLKPASYYASIRPTWHAKEEEARRAAEEEKRRKEEERARQAAEKAAAAQAKKEEAAKPAPSGKRTPEEIKAQREAMMAKKQARAQAGGEAEVKAEGVTTKPKRTPEEIKAQREAMMAKKQARAQAGGEAEAKAEEVTTKPKRTPEEIKAQREAMMAKRQQRAGQGAATEAAAEPASRAPDAPAKPDDLTKIEGIGPKISGLLQAVGINTFVDLSKAEVEKLHEILTAAGPNFKLANPATWPEQAALAAAGKWEELAALQEKLLGGRRS